VHAQRDCDDHAAKARKCMGSVGEKHDER
jgi:hypothetical protein